MFRNSVNKSALSGAHADHYFGDTIVFDYDKPDESFLATARAFLKVARDRLGSKKLYVNTKSYVRADRFSPDGMFAKRVLDDMNTSVEGINTIKPGTTRLFVAGLRRCDADRFKCLDDFFKENGFEEVTKITKFFKGGLTCRCYTKFNGEDGVSVFLVGNSLSSMATYHAVQCALPLLLPWFFEGENKLVPDSPEHKILLALYNENGYEQYLKELEAVAQAAGLDIEGEWMRHALTEFSKMRFKAEYDGACQTIDRLNRSIEEYSRQIAECLRNIDDEKTRKIGLETRMETQELDDEFMDYLRLNKALSIVDISGDRITVDVKTYLTNVEEKTADLYTKNTSRGNLFHGTNGVDAEDLAKVYRAAWVDHKIKFRVIGRVVLSIRNGMDAVGHAEFDAADTMNRMRAPHCDMYGCPGNYRAHINEALSHGDFVMAMEECIGLVASLNLDDSGPVSSFVNTLTNGCVCIELPDGRIVDVNGAIIYLNGEGAEVA